MQNNWVLLQGRLCHTPNYSATKRGLHKVAFRLAIPRPAHTSGGPPFPPTPDSPASAPLPALSPDSDYVTVIIIGAPAWEFKQLELQAGAPVRVQGRLRSWDVSTDYRNSPADPEEHLEPSAAVEGTSNPRRERRIEVIAEKVDSLDGATK